MPSPIHIVSFDVPYPPNYGGIVDVYFKIRSLHRLGYQVILHCYEYRQNERNPHLENICQKVYYYKRRNNPLDFLSPLPYIIASRQNPKLLSNLLQDDAPIMFEGLHCCYYLQHPKLRDRKRIVRMHNIEWKYYQALASQESNPLKKLHYNIESRKLKNFESKKLRDVQVLAINPAENEYLAQNDLDSQVVEAFHPYDAPELHPEKEDFVLFHGSLDVHENIKSAIWICEELASRTPEVEYLIAGKSPDAEIEDVLANHPNVKLVADPSIDELQNLIKTAQINLIVTFQNTGIKLKLLNALFVGGYCIANSDAIYASELEEAVIVADDPEHICQQIEDHMQLPFTVDIFESRRATLMQHYDNLHNAEKIARIMYS